FRIYHCPRTGPAVGQKKTSSPPERGLPVFGHADPHSELTVYLSHLSLTNYRSYEQAEFELKPGANILIGANGVGKTNVAEAINYLAVQHSHRVSNDHPLVRIGQ